MGTTLQGTCVRRGVRETALSNTTSRGDTSRSTTMHSLVEWGPAHLRDQLVGITPDFRDEDGERPDDN